MNKVKVLVNTSSALSSLRLNWLLLFYILVAAVLALRGPAFIADSQGYVEMWPIRPAVYPLLINILESIFGNAWSTVIVGLQLLILALSTYQFVSFFRSRISGSKLGLYFVAILLLLPMYKYGNVINTEAICFSLFLLSFVAFLKWFAAPDVRSLVVYLGLITILSLTRGQFVFLYGLPFVALLLRALRREITLRSSFVLVSLTLLFYVGLNISQRTYHYFAHGRFVSTPFTGVILIADVLYASDSSDAEVFSSEEDKRLFLGMIREMEEKKWNRGAVEEVESSPSKRDILYHYQNVYNRISFDVAMDNMLAHYENEKGIDRWISVNRHLMSMAFPLIIDNLDTYLELFFIDIVNNGFKGNLGFLFFGAVFGLSLFYLLFSRNDDFLLAAFFFGAVLVIFNNSLVGLVERIQVRYVFYTDLLFLILITLIVDQFFFRKYNNEETESFNGSRHQA